MSEAMPNGSAAKGTLVERATAAVRDYIRDNDLKVGDPLPGEGKFAGASVYSVSTIQPLDTERLKYILSTYKTLIII